MIRFQFAVLIVGFPFFLCRQSTLYSQVLTSTSLIETTCQALSTGKIELALDSIGKLVDQSAQTPTPFDSDLSAVAGGLYRELSQRSSDEQYTLLYEWTMPTENRHSLRILTKLVSQVAPPQEFARALGQRSRKDVFAIASVGEFRGLFCSAWMLVEAAEKTGRLRLLTSELELLIERRSTHSDFLWALARLADTKNTDPNLLDCVDGFEKRSEESEAKREPSAAERAEMGAQVLALAAVAAKRRSLRHRSEAMLQSLDEHASMNLSPEWRAYVRLAHAICVQLNHHESNAATIQENQLKYWIPASGVTADKESAGAVAATWLAQDEHLLHLAGSGNDLLFLRYPVIGNCNFQCETQSGGSIRTNGGLSYGGLQYELLGNLQRLIVHDSGMNQLASKPCLFVHSSMDPVFNRVSISVGSDRALFLSNLHPIWTDNSEANTSPWLGLRSYGDHRPLFRNLAFVGKTTIPREVKLLGKNEARGWRDWFSAPIQVAHQKIHSDIEKSSEEAKSESLTNYEVEWLMSEDVLQATNRQRYDLNATQSLLTYFRPLLDGESVQYEFFYEPGVYEVHAAIGRLAFLIEPEGIKIHWITSGNRDWTGLLEDNAVVEPLNRRGPRPLPLVENDWNRVKVARKGGVVTLYLGDTEIYQRPIDWGGEQTFGFFRSACSARIRNAIMTGDWPETLPQELLDNPTAVWDESTKTVDRFALNNIIHDNFISENVFETHRRAMSMMPIDRVAFLTRWIFPNEEHPSFRISGDFTQTDPAPISRAYADSPSGGTLVSPVFDLLDAIENSTQLDHLEQQLIAAPDERDDIQKRSRLALQSMIQMQRNDLTAASSTIDQLHRLMTDSGAKKLADLWPETLVAYRGIQTRKFEPIEILVADLYAQQTEQSQDSAWKTQLAALIGQHRIWQAKNDIESSNDRFQSSDWISVTSSTARSRGNGSPRASWTRTSDGITNNAGHGDDYLFYRTPVQGNFQVECDVTLPVQGTCSLMIAGTAFGAASKLSEFERGSFGNEMKQVPILTPLEKFDPWVHLRSAYSNRKHSMFLNGRLLESETKTHPIDPWIAIRSRSPRYNGSVRNLRVTGAPEVLEVVSLTASGEFVGWRPYFDDETLTGDSANWTYTKNTFESGKILGHKMDEPGGAFRESLLQYERPLIEDGLVEYDFFYEPDVSETHPALDRLVFMLDPDGIKVHWLTDGRYDRTEVAPDNQSVELDNRRGPERLPLRVGDWNRMRLTLRSDIVELELNSEVIYQRRLEPTNQRTIGLFHYSDRSEVHVRNATMRGEWPKTIPKTVNQQELAGDPSGGLDDDWSRLPATFHHDFRTQGFPRELFTSIGQSTAYIRPTREGLRVTRATGNERAQVTLAARLAVFGDFDAELTFDQLEGAPENKEHHVQFFAIINDDLEPTIRIGQSLTATGRRVTRGQMTHKTKDGKQNNATSLVANEADSGRMRLARRGDKIYTLFAEGDSGTYRVVSTEKISQREISLEKLRFSLSINLPGKIAVNFKTLSLRAERISNNASLSVSRQSVLRVMKVDDRSSLELTDSTIAGFTNLGSPEWSVDGTKIVADASNGSTSNSHILMINADGSGSKDLGLGCVPSLSPDNQRIVYSKTGSGVMMMNADGSDRQTIDASGWGAQWSPDGRYLAYGKNGNVILWDVATRESKPIFTNEQASRYSYIYWNLGWSPDSLWIGCKARSESTSVDEIVIASIESPNEFKVLYASDGLGSDIAWTSDNQSIMFSINSVGVRKQGLYLLSRSQTGAPEPFPSSPSDLKVLNADWSQDGQFIVMAGTRFAPATPAPQPAKGKTMKLAPSR